MNQTSDFDPEIIQEFILDAIELIENADKVLIKMEKKQVSFNDGYRSIYNALHTLKGSFGMFGYKEEMDYIHHLEETFKTFENKGLFDSDFSERLANSLKSLELRLKNPEHVFYQQGVNSQKTSTKVEGVKKTYYRVTTSISHSYILVIDDNSIVLDSFSEYFGKKFNVIAVESVNDGIQALNENPDIHVIFCDFHMPKNKGTKLLDYLNESNMSIPVIMMSDLADRKDLVELLKRHAFYFVEKQEEFPEFERALRKAQKERMKELSYQAHKLISDRKYTN